MRRSILLVVVVVALAAGLFGYTLLWFVDGTDELTATTTEFDPRLEVNTLTLEEAAGDGDGTQSCVTTVPSPGSWRLSGVVQLERNGSGPASPQPLAWTLTVDDGTIRTNGTVELDRYESERVTLMDVGFLSGQLDPGSTVPARLTVTHEGRTVVSLDRSLDVINRSEPPCAEQ